MRFEPRTPDEYVNVSPRHPLGNAATLIVGTALGIVLATFVLVATADYLVALVPARVEARVLDGWQPDGLFDGDQARAAPVQALLDSLARHWPDAPYRFRVAISDDDAANALALPGGLIVVTAGLLDGIGSENELAFVLAHELGHFRHRDHIRQLGRSAALGLAFALVGGRSDFAALWADVTVRGFSREQERRADRFALRLVHAHYGHVAHALDFFERVRGEAPSGAVAYFSTHPSPGDRIVRLTRLASRNGWPLTGPRSEWNEGR